MPRPNQPRSIASEQALARRIADLRERRGMSYEGLASRMTRAGCPIQASAIYKIEKADPPRRITVDELVALAEVFGLSVENLLLPPEVAESEELTRLAEEWQAARRRVATAQEDEDEAWARLRAFVDSHPGLGDKVESVMRLWVDQHPDSLEFAYQMYRLIGDDHWKAEVRRHLGEE